MGLAIVRVVGPGLRLGPCAGFVRESDGLLEAGFSLNPGSQIGSEEFKSGERYLSRSGVAFGVGVGGELLLGSVVASVRFLGS